MTTETQPMPARRGIVTVGLLLAVCVVAIEVTVVTTAMPTVVGELQGIDVYPWVFSAYLLTSTVTVPIFGKLADLYGRKPVFLAGMAVFLLGSLLCGFAASMSALVMYRAFQGLGAGAVQPLVLTIIGDLYPLKDRGKIQGALATVWATASLAGPALGAFLTLSYSWRLVFLINMPFGLLAAWFIWRYLAEKLERRTPAIDYAGAGAISVGLLLLLLTALEGGRSLPWGSAPMLVLVALGGGLLLLFVRIEQRAVEPLMPLGLFRIPVVAIASVGNAIQGAQIFALSAYIPLYVQGVRGESAAGSGVALTPLLLGWSLSALVAPRAIIRLGFRSSALISTVLILVGSLGLLLLGSDPPPGLLLVSMALLGFGFGPGATTFQAAVQEAVSWELRGVVTSACQLFRSLGGTVGVALLGALLNSRLQAALPAGTADHGALLNPAARGELSPEALTALQQALAGALQSVFGTLVVLGALAVAVVARYATNLPITAPRGASVPRRANR